MNNFHVRAIVADHLQVTNPAPANTTEWKRLLNRIDEAQMIAARKAVP